MLRSMNRLAITAVSVLLLVAGLEVAAVAKGVPQVSGLTAKGQNPCAATSSGQCRTTPRLARPALAGHGVPSGAEFTWGRVRGATRFRVAWSAVPFGKWPTRSFVSKWLPKRTRSSTFVMPAVPQSGDHMLGVAYANPVFGQLYARNARGTVRRSAGWVPVFPTAPDPGPGDPVRFGTYNVLGGPTAGARIDAIAANIRDHGLGIVALQEANEQTSLAVTQALGGNWAYLHFQTGTVASPPQQILYRTDSYRLLEKGTFPVSNTVDPSIPVVTPWARFLPVQASAASQPFLVTSVHEMDNTNRSVMDRKRDSGNFAREVMARVAQVNPGGNPVIVAGDLNYLREPYGDVPGYVEAPPTLVRGGYYDAMAALSKINIAYSTFNGGNGTAARTQTAIRSGVAGRSDYIMLKGFRGSNAYVNVANWSLNGLVPSDHNLVYADLTVPFK
jgi:endonuclease/exonuclease/phosphatase family metal-dependent hydrolase